MVTKESHRNATLNLMDLSHRMSLVISTVTIVIVQLLSLAIITWFMIADLDKKADKTADEIADILVEPLYNVDDNQVRNIGEAIVASGRGVSGIVIESEVSGTVLDIKPQRVSSIIKPRERTIVHKLMSLGTVRMVFSDAELFALIQGITLTLILMLAAVTFVSAMANQHFVQRRINEVFAKLMYGISGISSGRYDRGIPETGYLDMDAIIKMINEMADSIQIKNRQLLGMNKLLEQRVGERTAELETAFAEQRLLQDRLIESGKLSALGQLAAGVAHELNTPLGAINSSGRIILEYFDAKTPVLIDFIASLSPRELELFRAIVTVGVRENASLVLPIPSRVALRETAETLSRHGVKDADSIANLLCDSGLSASIGEFIDLFGTDRDLAIVDVACEPVVARRMAQVIGESAEKAAGVVGALKSYLVPVSSERGQLVDIDADIRKVLTLMHNMLKHGIAVRTDFGSARVIGSPDKLSQVWMNLIRNAAQAMEFRGTLSIATAIKDGKAVVTVEDSGYGIPDTIKDRIFEPFFSTKKHGDSMGLGLDICRKIVEAHQGSITFESKPGRTVFTVILPAATEDSLAEA